jgi:HD-GYP domain-containing protein (c-di-GMP phosphodiesterase class II)
MRLVRLESIREEMELARDIPSALPGALPLLRRGVTLSPALAARLATRGVRAVWIKDGLGDGIEPAEPLPPHVRRATEQAVGACLSAAQDAALGTQALPAATVSQLQSVADSVMQALDGCPEAALALDDLSTADSYTYSHSVRVATLGLVIGHRLTRLDGWIDWRGRRRYDRIHERMTELAMGLLIHDIGKISIPETVLNKPGRLTAEEWELIKTHPTAGASMLSPDRVSPLTICVVRDHHERWDGLGYRRGRTGTETHQFARIAAVADVYDAVTANRPYKPATSPHVGVRVVREGSGTQFDPDIVEHFRRVVMPYPIGYTIELPDGRTGVVCTVDPDDPERPLVRVRERDGALAEHRLRIVDGNVLEGAGIEPLAAPAAHAAPQGQTNDSMRELQVSAAE